MQTAHSDNVYRNTTNSIHLYHIPVHCKHNVYLPYTGILQTAQVIPYNVILQTSHVYAVTGTLQTAQIYTV